MKNIIDKIDKDLKPLLNHINKSWIFYVGGFVGYGMIIDGLIHRNISEVYRGIGLSAISGFFGYLNDNKDYKSSKG